MVKILSNSEMLPKGNYPNMVKLAWNDPNLFSNAVKNLKILEFHHTNPLVDGHSHPPSRLY